jgi:hypothetical protein
MRESAGECTDVKCAIFTLFIISEVKTGDRFNAVGTAPESHVAGLWSNVLIKIKRARRPASSLTLLSLAYRFAQGNPMHVI